VLYDPSNPKKSDNNSILGPYRVFPGRLSVSRTFGDIEAKREKFGGNPNVVVASPEIKEFLVDDDKMDFLLLGCKLALPLRRWHL
jgi:serine/threonine protein phosphatase PrpC